jgi:hypothetical protein
MTHTLALNILKRYGHKIINGFIITKGLKSEHKHATIAINYLCSEWDYCAMSQARFDNFIEKEKENLNKT